MDMYIFNLIMSIKQRPKMYLKEEKIEYIYYLLSGYCGANNLEKKDDIDSKFMIWFGKWLIWWIQENIDKDYEIKTAFWYEDIKRISKDENNECVLFYELCQKFYDDYMDKKGYFEWRK